MILNAILDAIVALVSFINEVMLAPFRLLNLGYLPLISEVFGTLNDFVDMRLFVAFFVSYYAVDMYIACVKIIRFVKGLLFA